MDTCALRFPFLRRLSLLTEAVLILDSQIIVKYAAVSSLSLLPDVLTSEVVDRYQLSPESLINEVLLPLIVYFLRTRHHIFCRAMTF